MPETLERAEELAHVAYRIEDGALRLAGAERREILKIHYRMRVKLL